MLVVVDRVVVLGGDSQESGGRLRPGEDGHFDLVLESERLVESVEADGGCAAGCFRAVTKRERSQGTYHRLWARRTEVESLAEQLTPLENELVIV